MFAQRTADPTGKNNGLWCSPHRDIAHIYPYMVRQAIELASQRIDRFYADDVTQRDIEQDELGVVAKAVAKFIRLAASDPETVDYRDALETAQLDVNHCDDKALERFESALVYVMNQVYFQAIREAIHSGKALGFDELMKFVDERYDGKRS